MCKRFIQLAGVVGVLAVAACSDVIGPRYQSYDRVFLTPPEQAGDTTNLLSEVLSGR